MANGHFNFISVIHKTLNQCWFNANPVSQLNGHRNTIQGDNDGQLSRTTGANILLATCYLVCSTCKIQHQLNQSVELSIMFFFVFFSEGSRLVSEGYRSINLNFLFLRCKKGTLLPPNIMNDSHLQFRWSCEDGDFIQFVEIINITGPQPAMQPVGVICQFNGDTLILVTINCCSVVCRRWIIRLLLHLTTLKCFCIIHGDKRIFFSLKSSYMS